MVPNMNWVGTPFSPWQAGWLGSWFSSEPPLTWLQSETEMLLSLLATRNWVLPTATWAWKSNFEKECVLAGTLTSALKDPYTRTQLACAWIADLQKPGRRKAWGFKPLLVAICCSAVQNWYCISISRSPYLWSHSSPLSISVPAAQRNSHCRHFWTCFTIWLQQNRHKLDELLAIWGKWACWRRVSSAKSWGKQPRVIQFIREGGNRWTVGFKKNECWNL